MLNFAYGLGVIINIALLYVNASVFDDAGWSAVNTVSGILCAVGYFNTLGENNGHKR